MPSLNKRVEDIASLIDYFLLVLCKDSGKNTLVFALETIAIFESYDWPGNIRQLKNTLEWLIIMYGHNIDFVIKPLHLPKEILGFEPNKNEYNFSSELELSLKDARKIFEANYLKSQLIRFKGNISRTSTFVGMDRSALHRKLKELSININELNY